MKWNEWVKRMNWTKASNEHTIMPTSSCLYVALYASLVECLTLTNWVRLRSRPGIFRAFSVKDTKIHKSQTCLIDHTALPVFTMPKLSDSIAGHWIGSTVSACAILTHNNTGNQAKKKLKLLSNRWSMKNVQNWHFIKSGAKNDNSYNKRTLCEC